MQNSCQNRSSKSQLQSRNIRTMFNSRQKARNCFLSKPHILRRCGAAALRLTVNARVVSSIQIRGNELFPFPCSGNKSNSSVIYDVYNKLAGLNLLSYIIIKKHSILKQTRLQTI